MRAVVAKQLRRQAERETVGARPETTRRRYKALKRMRRET